MTTQGKTRRGVGALRTSSACLPRRPVFHAQLAIAWPHRPARSSHRRVARGHSVGSHAFASTSRLGRCSAGRRRCWRSGCRMPRGPEAGARLRSKRSSYWGRRWPPRASRGSNPPLRASLEARAAQRPGPLPPGLALTIMGSRRGPSLISTRQFVFSPAMSQCCGKRPGFWRRAPIRWSAMEHGASNWRSEQSSFPGARVRAFDALAAALAESEQFSAAVDAAEQASTMALGNDGGRGHGGGRACTAKACPIASRQRPCQPIMCRRQRISRRPARPQKGDADSFRGMPVFSRAVG